MERPNESHAGDIGWAGIRLTPDLAQRWLSEGFINNHKLEEIAKLVEGDY